MSTTPYQRQEDPLKDLEDPNATYIYHHGTGKHILVKSDPDINRPKYSWSCFCCNLLDFLIFAGCIAFLFFSIRYALYLLNNSDGGG